MRGEPPQPHPPRAIGAQESIGPARPQRRDLVIVREHGALAMQHRPQPLPAEAAQVRWALTQQLHRGDAVAIVERGARQRQTAAVHLLPQLDGGLVGRRANGK